MARQAKRKQKHPAGRKKSSSKSATQKQDTGASPVIRAPEEQ